MPLVAGKGGRKGVSSAVKAGLIVSPSRGKSYLRKYFRRISPGAAVYLAAVIEYLAAELMEESSKAAIALGKKRITPRSIKLAVANDEELNRMFRGAVAEGGVLPTLKVPKKDEEGKKEKKHKKHKKSKKGSKKSKGLEGGCDDEEMEYDENMEGGARRRVAKKAKRAKKVKRAKRAKRALRGGDDECEDEE